MTAHDHVLVADAIGVNLTIALVGSHPVALKSLIEGGVAVVRVAALSTEARHVHSATLIKLRGATSVLVGDLSPGHP